MTGQRQRQGKRVGWRWLAAAGMLLLFALGFLLWARLPAASDARPLPQTQTGEAEPSEPPSTVGLPGVSAPPVAFTPEPVKLPAGTGRYLSRAKPGLEQVSQRADACSPVASELDTAARLHLCRFISGSGQFLPDYAFGMPVPETEAVTQDWFADAVFIGNSLEQGFMLYAGLETGDIFATQSINVTNIYFQKVVNSDSGMLTLLEAMARRQYGKIFIMLGINELSYATTDSFYEGYAQLLEDIREMEPGAEIYLQSITPVSAAKSASSTIFNNPRIAEFNEVIRQLAEDKEAHYLYVFDALADEDGCLPRGSSEDGIHPYGKYYPQWLTYLMTHTVTEAKR